MHLNQHNNYAWIYPDCTMAKEIREVTLEDEHLIALAELELCGWPSTKAELQKELNHICCSRMK